MQNRFLRYCHFKSVSDEYRKKEQNVLMIKELREQCCIYNSHKIAKACFQDICDIWYQSSLGIAAAEQNVALGMDILQN